MDGFHFFFFSSGLGEATEDGGDVAGSSRVVSLGVLGRGGGDMASSKSGSPENRRLSKKFLICSSQ